MKTDQRDQKRWSNGDCSGNKHSKPALNIEVKEALYNKNTIRQSHCFVLYQLIIRTTASANHYVCYKIKHADMIWAPLR